MADTIIGNIPYSQIRQKTYINGTYEDISELGKALEKAGVSFSGRIGYRSAITVEQSDKNKVLEIFEQLKKEKTVVTENRNGIIGNTEYRYIRDKKYINGDTDIMLRVADRLKNENISFSGRTVGDKTTLTVSGQQMQELVNRYVSEEQEGIADPRTEYEIRLCSDTDLGKYCISEINSDSGQETSKHTYNGHTAVFDSIDECIAFGELHKMSFINSSEQLDLLRNEENSEKIRRMQELISRIDPTSDHFEFHRDSSVEMSYFNADGGENGQFVIMHIHENDVIGAVEKMADSTDDKLKVFLNSLYENCSTEVIDSDENNFISYAEMFIDEESSVSKCHDGNAEELAAIVDRIIDNFSETRSETLENNISLNKQLEELTKEITEKEKALTAYVKERRYAQAAAAAAELDDLSKQAEKMRTEIQQETITKDDVDILRSITPKRKSVQNMLENEVAKTAKFDKLLGDEMGEKSAYEMRRTNNAWRKDENKTASIIRITPRERPEKITDIRKDKNIEKGIYTNKDTGMAIHFGNAAIGEIIAKAIPDDKRNIPVDARLSAIYQMKEIIENSICFDSRVSEYDDITSKNKSPNTLFIHRLYGILKYNNDFYLSNLAVEEMYTKMENGQMEDTHNRVYSLRDIKITPVKLSSLKARTDPQNEFADKDTSSGVTEISIPQLYDFVKAFDGSFFENSSSIGRAEREAEIQAHNEYLKAREKIEKEAKTFTGSQRSEMSIQLSQEEFIEIASNLLSADKIVSNAHRYSDEQNYRIEIDNGIDRIFTEALTGKRDIGYSVSEIAPLYNQFQNNGEIREYIQNIVFENVDISLSSEEQRKVNQEREFEPDSEDGQFELFHIEENRPYQVITYDSGSGADDKGDYVTLREAQKNAKEYLKDGYEGYAVYNTNTQTIEETAGYFPSERIFSFDVLIKNGIITPEQEPEMIKEFKEKDIHDSVIAELLKMESLKAAAKNNSREDFVFPYYDAINETLINMLESSNVYSAQKEISYLLNDEEYLHNVFGDYDTVLQQLNTSEIEDNRSHQEAEPSANSGDPNKLHEVFESAKKEYPDLSERAETFISDIDQPVTDDFLMHNFSYVKEDKTKLLTINRVGDFWELYGNDARIAAEVLDLHLTRKNGKDMCGFPDFKKDEFIQKLQEAGYSVVSGNAPDVSQREEQAIERTAEQKEKPYKPQPAVSLMSDLSETAEKENTEEKPQTVTLEYKGTPENIQNFKEQALYVGDVTDSGDSIEVYTSDNQKEKPDTLAKENGLTAADDLSQTELSYNMEESGTDQMSLFEKSTYVSIDEVPRNFVEDINSPVGNSEQKTLKDKNDYSITDEQYGTSSGAKTRFENNAAAIALLKKIESEGRNATPEEQEVLAKYVGWGGIPQVFDSFNNQWSREYAQLKELLTESEYNTARASTMNAHYTSPTIIGAIYTALDNMGFSGGKVLEPAMGIGNFFGAMPEKMRNNSQLAGVELDSITGRIAKQLYQSANIQVTGYEKTSFENNSFDVAVGNVPFGSYKVNDKDYNRLNMNIHDFFFAKSLDKVHAGGIVAFVTSSGTLDKENPSVRKYLAERAELLGAIRLPSNAFKSNAGTEVTTDIIFLQKRDKPVSIEKNTPEWVFKGILDNGIAVNKYFADNPDMILGEMAEGNKLYGSGTMCIPKEGADLKQQLTEAVNKIKGEYRKAEKETERTEEHLQDIVSCPPDAPKFSFIVENDRLYYHEADDTMTAVKGKDSDIARIKEMAALRETVNDLLRLQIENSDGTLEKSISETQHKLNDMYDCFVEKYGRISSKDNQKLFSDDNAYHLIKNLEVFDDDGNFSRKADIFDKITINPQIIIDHCDNANDALILSLAEKVSVDMEYMSELTGKSEDELIAELGDKIYQDPQNGMRWESADEYLTGNIRTKLAAAQEAGLERNIKALEAVMPERIEAADISVKLGASWIDPKYIKQFIVETLKPDFFTRQKLNVVYSEAADKWKIEGYNTTGYHNTLAAETYGTADMNAYEIIEAALNLKKIEIKDRKKDEQGREMRDDKGNYILEVNHRKTTVAQSKKEEIERKFADWIFDDVDRRKTLTDLYNEKFNSVRLREYDGSHLNFVGMNNSIELKDHQKNAVARALYSNGNTLLAHEVGAGKSYEMIAIAMEGKRLGLHSKSMIAVPNALTEQLGNEFRKLYPNANVLVATEKDFRKENRRDLFAKIATGDWDAVIVGHTQLDSIHLSDERELQMLNRETETLREALIEAKAASVGGSSFSVKQIERSIKTYEDKITKLLAKTPEDDMLNFESLGIDKLFVDESQNYKNLNVPTKMQNVAGLGGSAAGKSMELLMKCHYLDEITGGKGTIFASGTPISNSISEMYSLLRYLQNSKLEELGISSFDRWASVFGETTTSLELSPEGNGKYQSKTRFSKFQNLPELMTLFRECADIKTAESLNLPRPECEVHNVNIPASALQRSLINELGERARLVRSGAVKPNEDNMLVITSDGRKIGLDVRCIDPSLPDDPNSKVNVCVKNVFDIYQKTGDNKGTQLIFCDLATPQAKSNENYFEILRKDENGEFNSIFKGTLGEKDNAERILKNSKGKRLSKAMESIGGISDGDIIMTSRVNYDEQAAYKTAHSVKDGKTAEIPTEMWEELHTSPVESFKSERRFSVYDDIKQKLVDMGIPEKEIAFIHDADTSQQKQEMFDRMNNGEIRVMIGSTQKCGAGMNAQKRMAALHDLDCPMRPSDMTQRHGRILRQGNSYDKVDIFRYTTDNTFDAYLYQMLENKQKFISQIMTEKTPVRSCEDVDEAVLDYAEVKALCAGNPLIREKIDIETEITKLNVLKSSFLSQKYTMQTKASEIIPREIAQTEKHIEKLQSDLELSAAEKPETNEEGKKYFPVTVGNTVYTDKEEAGTALRQAVLKNGSIIEGKECAVGKYRGFEVSAFFDAFNKKFKICLNGDSKHYGELNMDQNVKASGNIIRMDNVIGNIQAELITEQKKLESLKVDLSEAKTLAEQAFPQESELIAKQKRLDEINILLMQQPGGRGQELYEALAEICPEIQYTDDLYCKYEAGKGIEPLSVERHGDIVFLAHTYEQNGDLMYDPAYEFKIDTQNRTAEIISYELSGMGVYQTFDKDSPERADAENSALDLTLIKYQRVWI